MGAIEGRDLVEVQEGRARILVPRTHATKGPGKATGRPFYNRAMALPRHVSVLVFAAVGDGSRRVLDALAATGVLGVRLALEGPGDPELTVNDKRPDARPLICRNLARNGVEGRVLSEDANVLFCREHFDYVDVDPFGTPVPFLDNAVRCLAPRGILGVTATDTAPLAGTYPRTCRRRYGATPRRGPVAHEVGLRILGGAVVRTAAKYEVAARPLLSLWRGHCYKQFFALRQGARRADEALEHVGYLREEEGTRTVAPEGEAGPLWAGPLHDAALLEEVTVPDYMPGEVLALVERWREEAPSPAFFYTTDEMASRLRVSPPPIRQVLTTLHEGGYRASRTSFHPKGVKTDATWGEILRLLAAS